VTFASPLKVLFLTSSYPRSTEDSASVFLRYLAEALAKRHIEVHVLAPSAGKSHKSTEDNVTVHRFQYFPVRLQKLAYGSGIMPNLARSPWLWIQVPFFVYSMTHSLIRVLRTERPSVIHAHWIIPQGLIAVIVKHFVRTPVITTAHGADVFALRGKFKTTLKRLVLSGSNAWTANSRATADGVAASACLPAPRTIAMGVDVKLFAGGNRERLRRQIDPEELLILFVGRLVEKKGCRDLILALSFLPDILRLRTTLWIVGEGNQRDDLERTVKRLKLQEKVHFWGAVSNQRLPDFYAAADVFVAPSIEAASGDTEGLGVVLLEAFAGRACVLATRTGGISSVVTDNVTGLLVEQRNPKALAGGIAKLLTDSSLRVRLVENAYTQVTERYSWRQIGQEFEDLYRKVCHLPTPDL
jgi:glycosyltransferase involved in cell wall biosynthesis